MYYLNKHNPAYMGELGCACDNMGMVSPANVATLGLMPVNPTVSAYEKAIVKVKAKINALKKKRASVKLQARKKIIDARLVQLKKQLEKLQGYLAIKRKKRLGKGSSQSADVVLPEEEAIFADIDLPEADLTADEIIQEEINLDQGGMPMWMMATLGVLAVGGAYLAFNKLGGSKVRRNRLKIGKKRNNPKKRKAIRKKRK